jgi:bacterioferritin
MQGDAEVIELLNDLLTGELTAINQYFLHARMQKNWGYNALAEHTYKESIEEMRHAEQLTDRILFLEGVPNLQRLRPIGIGETVKEQFESDLSVEHDALARLRPGIAMCRTKGDVASANLLEAILGNEEEHIDWLETQLALITSLGEPLYLAGLVDSPS